MENECRGPCQDCGSGQKALGRSQEKASLRRGAMGVGFAERALT
jgi:hypothetical protein